MTHPTDNPTRKLYTLPTGEFAIVESMADHMDDPNAVGWVAVYWGNREDYDADMRQDGGDPYADRATFSAVVDTEADALAELGDGATLTA